VPLLKPNFEAPEEPETGAQTSEDGVFTTSKDPQVCACVIWHDHLQLFIIIIFSSVLERDRARGWFSRNFRKYALSSEDQQIFDFPDPTNRDERGAFFETLLKVFIKKFFLKQKLKIAKKGLRVFERGLF
jgi:hypothetical protein